VPCVPLLLWSVNTAIKTGSNILTVRAHLLLQTRVKTLNHELGSMFKRWYPDMEVEELTEAA
jgi:hypothetical protein